MRLAEANPCQAGQDGSSVVPAGMVQRFQHLVSEINGCR
jgi:hypothetical protein